MSTTTDMSSRPRTFVWRRRALTTAGAGLLLAFSGVAVHLAGIRVNVTPSEPLGVWCFQPLYTLSRGLVVSACVPPTPVMMEAKNRGYLLSGACPGNMTTVIKAIVAVPGDTVRIDKNGVFVNGLKVSDVAPAERDTVGRPLHAAFTGDRLIAQGDIFLLSDYSPKSFDSRYFGVVPIRNIQHVAVPLLTTRWKPKGF